VTEELLSVSPEELKFKQGYIRAMQDSLEIYLEESE